MEERIEYALEQRCRKGTLRTLPMSSVSPIGSTSSTTTTSSFLLEPLHVNVSPMTISNSTNSSASSIDNTITTTTTTKRTKIDFSSNDYLGLASDKEQIDLVNRTYNEYIIQQQQQQDNNNNTNILGSTGSRLLSGDTHYIHILEKQLALIHTMKTSLIYNSGYVANIGIISCLPCSIILYDEYCHNSIQMGIRLWKSYDDKQQNLASDNTTTSNEKNIAISFQHNNIHDLEIKLQQQRQRRQRHDMDPIICIIIESVYSMDGDIANILQILQLAIQYNAYVIVDEAHSIGVYDTLSGTGLTTSIINNYTSSTSTSNTGITISTNDNATGSTTNYQNQNQNEQEQQLYQYKLLLFNRILCIIYPLGKGPGCHGAVVCTNNVLYKEYLINYSYPFIYSTSLPIHTLITIQCSYQTFTSYNNFSFTNSISNNSSSSSNGSCSSSSGNSNKGQQLRKKLLKNIHYFQKHLKHQLHLYYTSITDSNNSNNTSSSSTTTAKQTTCNNQSSSIVYCWLREQSTSSTVAERQEQKHNTTYITSTNTNTATNNSCMNDDVAVTLVSPIQALMISGGNEICTKFCTIVYSLSGSTIKLYPIKFPTIPIGQERIRIIIHSTNTIQHINYLINIIIHTLHILNDCTNTTNNKLLSKL